MFCVQGSVKLILSIHMLIEYNTYIYDSTLDSIEILQRQFSGPVLPNPHSQTRAVRE